MIYLLDTNVCIYLIKRKPVAVLKKFEACSVGDIAISTISVAELQFGVQKSSYPDRNKRALEQFLVPLTVVDFNYQAALVYGEIRSGLETEGTPIGALDTLIAAHALSLGLIVITNNEKEFLRVPGLKVENWVTT